MISFDTSLEYPPAPEQHDWWVMEALGMQPWCLFLMCKITKKAGVVWNPTPEELAAAAGPPGWKYKLDDAHRVEIRQEEGGNE